jgi:hypothetical protein
MHGVLHLREMGFTDPQSELIFRVLPGYFRVLGMVHALGGVPNINGMLHTHIMS